MKSKFGFSIIIPTYNERLAIASVISDIQKLSGNFEVIVVDDGSTDGTFDLVAEGGVKVLKHPTNRGYGASLKTGIKSATFDSIVITDADGTYPTIRIPELIEIFDTKGCDMVVGVRVGEKSKFPIIRRPAKWFITKLASYLTETKIPDLNSGLRVMKKDVVEKYLNILPDRFSFTSTITIAMLINGYQVEYVPIDYFKRTGKSKIRPIQDTLNFIQLVIRTILYFNPLKVFFPLSLFLALFAFLVLIASWILTGKAMDVTFGVILMNAMLVMVIGMLADLINKRLQ